MFHNSIVFLFTNISRFFRLPIIYSFGLNFVWKILPSSYSNFFLTLKYHSIYRFSTLRYFYIFSYISPIYVRSWINVSSKYRNDIYYLRVIWRMLHAAIMHKDHLKTIINLERQLNLEFDLITYMNINEKTVLIFFNADVILLIWAYLFRAMYRNK